MQLGILQGPGHPCNTLPPWQHPQCRDLSRHRQVLGVDAEHGSRPQNPGSAVHSISSDFMYVRTLFLY